MAPLPGLQHCSPIDTPQGPGVGTVPHRMNNQGTGYLAPSQDTEELELDSNCSENSDLLDSCIAAVNPDLILWWCV